MSRLLSAMRGKYILLIGLLFSTTAFAQGTFLYTWHGDSGLFQASFQVTAEENQPGQYFESQTFYNSIRFISPDDTFTYIWPDDIAEGQTGPLNLSFTLFDSAAQRVLEASAYQSWAVIRELDTASNNQLWVEPGYWGATSIPEPSTGALLAFAALVWQSKRTRFFVRTASGRDAELTAPLEPGSKTYR